MQDDEIRRLRAERENYQNQAYKTANQIDKMLSAFDNDDGDELITFFDLKQSVLHDIYNVNDKVSFIPIKISEEQLKFITVVEAGGEFGTQLHDIKEYCKILKGHLIEGLEGDREYNVGDIVNYNAYKRHKPKSNMFSIYLVTFNLNEK